MTKYIYSFLIISLFISPSFTLAQATLPSNTGGSTTGTVCVNLTYSLSLGSKDAYTNGDVSKLQTFLQSKGYLTTSISKGYFGSLTKTAVISFQTANGIDPTGYVGSVTRAKIKSITCETTTPPPVVVEPTPACFYSLYDYDNNGKLDSSDTQLLGSYLAIGNFCPSGKVCDVNKGGTFTVADVTALGSITNGDKTWCPSTGTPACYVKAYDYNDSGKLDSADADLLLSYSSLNYPTGYCPAGKICDINKGGSINSTDATALLGLIGGSTTWCPAVGTPACYYSQYDYDNNSRLDSSDSQLLGSYLAIGSSCPTGKICDVNKGGTFTVADVTALSSIIGGNATLCPATTTPVSIPSAPQIAAKSYSFSCGLNGTVTIDAQIAWTNVPTNDPNGVTYTLRDGENIVYTGKETQYNPSVSQNSSHSYSVRANNSAGSSAYSSPIVLSIPTSSTTCSPVTPICSYAPYDYNNNGKLDSVDVELLMSYTAIGGSCPTGKVCDVNKSGVFNSTDVTALSSIINGTSVCPVEPTPACFFYAYDYDNSGKLDSNDIQLLGNYLNTSCPSTKICDVNQNGAFTIADVTALGSIVGGNAQMCNLIPRASASGNTEIANVLESIRLVLIELSKILGQN